MNEEFSVVTKLVSTDGKQYNTRVFTEDGIYEVTMLAKTEKAKQFRATVSDENCPKNVTPLCKRLQKTAPNTEKAAQIERFSCCAV